jgi:hypothetical protein
VPPVPSPADYADARAGEGTGGNVEREGIFRNDHSFE